MNYLLHWYCHSTSYLYNPYNYYYSEHVQINAIIDIMALINQPTMSQSYYSHALSKSIKHFTSIHMFEVYSSEGLRHYCIDALMV